MEKLLIKDAHIATSSEEFDGSVLAVDGKITRIMRGACPAELADGAQVVDARGQVLLPGGVDAHTHFDLDVGFTRASDDFYTGTVAAACGGTTTVVDHMAFGPQDCALGHQVEVYHELARDAVVDYGYHGVIQHVDEPVLADMETLLHTEGISSYKVYLTYDFGLDDADILRVLRRAEQLGVTICAHCENDAVVNTLRRETIAHGQTAAHFHPLSRPPEAEAEAVFRMLMLARVAGDAKVHVVHLSSALGLEALRLARGLGQQNILAETCPQYLLLDDSLYADDREGLKYIMSPPLRKPRDIEALWQAVQSGEIDTIGTDHCPFFFATQKQRGAGDYTLCPNGAPGVELRMPLLFSEYRKGKLTLPQLVRLCCTRPAEIFGLAPRKGDIAEGADADFVLFDPAAEWTVTVDRLHENVDYTPYEGLQLCGRPVMTISRGEIIARDGEFCGAKARGHYLKRST